MTEPRVVIIVPRRAGIPDRDRLWAFAKSWWAENLRWDIAEGHHDVGPFNRSMAINKAAWVAGDWDVAVIIDADVICGPSEVRGAVRLATETGGMVLGYHERVMLTERGTEAVMDGFVGNRRNPAYSGRVHMDSCSSCVVVTRELFDKVGGFDERFVGWGWEDVAFRIACETLSGVPMERISGTCWHLHHTVSHENNRREATLQSNEVRGQRYAAAHWDTSAVMALLNEPDGPTEAKLEPTRIPRILHRTVPAETSPQVEAWWEHWRQLHPGWDLKTWRDPLSPAEWPHTSDLWEKCQNGAQLAGLIRLEALWTYGGVYVDSDVEPYRSLEPLLNLPGFAAWEDYKVIPDAVLGAEPGHPAVMVMMLKARHTVSHGGDAWNSGPGVTTSTLPNRPDWLVLPPGTFYPYHYNERHRRGDDHMTQQPWSFGAHHWAGSWLTVAQRASHHIPAPVRRTLAMKMPGRAR